MDHETDGRTNDGFTEFHAIEPEVRQLIARAGVDIDCPDQTVRGMLMVLAVAIVRLARAQDLDITDAAKVGQVVGMQLPRLVAQMGSRGSRRSPSGRKGATV